MKMNFRRKISNWKQKILFKIYKTPKYCKDFDDGYCMQTKMPCLDTECEISNKVDTSHLIKLRCLKCKKIIRIDPKDIEVVCPYCRSEFKLFKKDFNFNEFDLFDDEIDNDWDLWH